MLDLPMRDAPGSGWEYVSSGVILLGGVVGRAVGWRIDVYGDDRLFGPLGASGAHWITGQPNLVHTGGGLYMGGRWRGQQVVAESRIRESIAPTVFNVRRVSPTRTCCRRSQGSEELRVGNGNWVGE